MMRSGGDLPVLAPAGPDTADGPIISVVVPTYERPDALRRCMRALAAQTLAPEQFEVIVCDDGSSCGDAASDLRAELGAVSLRTVGQANAGPAAARNQGAALARGRYLAFTDDDCEPAADWLERIVSRFSARQDVLLGGALRNGYASDVYAATTHAIMDFVYAERWRRSGVRLFSTSNLSLPAAGFRELGGFSPQFPDAAGEDYDLCLRWQESGRRAEYAPDAVIVHRHGLKLGMFLGTHFCYGRGLLRVRRRRAARRRTTRGPGPGFYLRLVLHPLRRWREAGSWRLAALIGASQVATVLGAMVELVHPTRPRTQVAKSTSTIESN